MSHHDWARHRQGRLWGGVPPQEYVGRVYQEIRYDPVDGAGSGERGGRADPRVDDPEQSVADTQIDDVAERLEEGDMIAGYVSEEPAHLALVLGGDSVRRERGGRAHGTGLVDEAVASSPAKQPLFMVPERAASSACDQQVEDAARVGTAVAEVARDEDTSRLRDPRQQPLEQIGAAMNIANHRARGGLHRHHAAGRGVEVGILGRRHRYLYPTGPSGVNARAPGCVSPERLLGASHPDGTRGTARRLPANSAVTRLGGTTV